jgi:DMSO/TMAO reductase YedYZ molybdopterin-dependent catalytic subunit
MKRKLIIILVAASLAAVLGFFIYFIAENELSRTAADDDAFVPEDIDISTIEDDVDFAMTIPEYQIRFSGLLDEDMTTDFLTILEDHMDMVEVFDASGVRTDGEEVRESFTGLKVKHLIEGLDILDDSQNVIIYATDLYAAQFSLDEVTGDDLYLAWKKNGQYLNPSADGIIKIVADEGPTTKWVKNPVLFDFIAGFSDLVPEADDLGSTDIDFISQQNFFTLSLGFIPDIDIGDWTLDIGGLVSDPFQLTYDQILDMPRESVFATLETISNPPGGSLIGNAVWTGVPFSHIMEMAGLDESVLEVVFYCEDGYSTSITIEEASQEGVMMAYSMNGRPLTSEHGFPVRMVVPEKYGMKWPKWINEIEFVDYDYKGYWEQRGWSDYAGRDRPEQRYD